MIKTLDFSCSNLGNTQSLQISPKKRKYKKKGKVEQGRQRYLFRGRHIRNRERNYNFRG